MDAHAERGETVKDAAMGVGWVIGLLCCQLAMADQSARPYYRTRPDERRFRTSWVMNEETSPDPVQYVLTGRCGMSADEQSSTLALALTYGDKRWSRTTTLGDSFNDEMWAETDFVIPIRVAEDPRPQVFAWTARSNWTDYTLYAIVEGAAGLEIRRVFSFSCRGLTPAWHVRNGKLTGFTTCDAFEPAPKSLQDAHPEIDRWEAIEEWRFIAKQHAWVAGKPTWREYKSGKDWNPPSIDHRADCAFLFTGDPSAANTLRPDTALAEIAGHSEKPQTTPAQPRASAAHRRLSRPLVAALAVAVVLAITNAATLVLLLKRLSLRAEDTRA